MNDSVMVALKELRDLEDQRTREETARRLAIAEAEKKAREDAERKVALERAREEEARAEKARAEIQAKKADEDARIAALQERLDAERRMRAEIEMRMVAGIGAAPAPARSAGGVLGWVSAGIAAAAVGFAFFVMTRQPPVVERVVEVRTPAEDVSEARPAAPESPLPESVAQVEPEAQRPERQTKRNHAKRPPVQPQTVMPEFNCDENDPTCGI